MKVSNPLTVVAIFAGTAEVFATGALVLLPETMQERFINFVMFFPILIVVSFFLVLLFKPQALYAPSDFSNEEHYLQANKIKKLVAENTEMVLADTKFSGENSHELKSLSEKVANLTVQSLEDDLDNTVLEYMTLHSKEAFTPRALSFLIAAHKRSINESLLRLESAGKVQSGMDGTIEVWQVKS
ncbi:hypothetical protein [Vibrio mediterranei]|uniref:hypothetical protein n=1 Tax=Vibrio mediterranei TaxID=689 RepID=UPI001EFE8929|nr:hypothetical protein [Vibrio mediterranei]MCG9658351.1 hypothetical protein [Vibrio mediterranei]